MKRRSFLKQSMYGLGGAAGLSLLYTWQVEPFWLEFVRLQMTVRNLPIHLKGKTLMHISDVHVGKRFDYRYLIKAFEKATSLNPDFVVYTGDYITLDGDKPPYDLLSKVLDKAVKGSIGTVAVLGNHDYGIDWKQEKVADHISDMFSDRGIEMLRNEEKDFAGLNFIGFDDYWSTNFKPDVIMESYDASKANIVLCHNPDVCDLDVWNGYQGWILSGHTHGGQCKPPFLPAPILPVANRNYTAGKVDLVDGRTVYINRAVGHLFQVRFNVRPEITIFELTTAD